MKPTESGTAIETETSSVRQCAGKAHPLKIFLETGRPRDEGDNRILISPLISILLKAPDPKPKLRKDSKPMKITQKAFRAHRTLIALCILAGTLLPALAQIPMATEPFSRLGRTEVYGIGQYLHSSDITFNGPFGDVKTKMDDTGLGGFGVAYHFSDFFSVRGDFMFGGATFSGNVPLETGGTTFIKQDAFIQTGRFNIDYNMINRRITPVLTAGIGYQYLETELTHLPPVNACWWDPWWGWICTTTHPVAWETDFTWNAGAGFRWNILDNLFIKAMANATWLEYSGSHGITTQIEGIFSIGWSF